MGGKAPAEVLLPPAVGEDACAIAIGGGALVAATDPITLTAKEIGGHAVVINANDVAVTGVRPRWFQAVVLLPPGTGADAIEALFADMHAALARLDVALVGGHTEITAAVTQPIVIGQMLGFREDGRFVRTAGMGLATSCCRSVRRRSKAPRCWPTRPRSGSARCRRTSWSGAAGGPRPRHLHRRAGAAGGRSRRAGAARPDRGRAVGRPARAGRGRGLALVIDPEAVLWFAPGRAVCAALGADPWGTLASGTLLAAFPEEPSSGRRQRSARPGMPVRPARPGRGGIGRAHDRRQQLRRFEQDEVSRILG